MKKKAFSLLLAVVIFCGGYYVGQNTTDYQSTASQTPTSQAASSTQRAYSSDIVGKSTTTHNSAGSAQAVDYAANRQPVQRLL